MAMSRCLLAALAVFGCGGQEGTGTSASPPASTTTIGEESDGGAEVLVELSGEIEALLVDVASADRGKQLDRASQRLRDIEKGVAELPGGGAGADAKSKTDIARKAARRLLAEIDPIVDGLPALVDGEAVERQPGLEAQAEVEALATTAEKLKARAQKAERLAAVLDESLSTTTESSSGEIARAAKLLSRSIGARGRELTALAVSLEPVDVITDCTSEFNTVSGFSVRNMDCSEAEALLIEAIQSLAPSFQVGSFSCSILGDFGGSTGADGEEIILGAEDIRCEDGDRAFRFNFAD